MRAITVEVGLKPEEQIKVMESKRTPNREMRRRDTRRKGNQQGSKKSSRAELEKQEKKTRLKIKSYCPQKKLAEDCQRDRSEAILTVQRREEAEKKPKKRTEALRVSMVQQALGD